MPNERFLSTFAQLAAISFGVLLAASALAAGQSEFLAYSFPLSTRTTVSPCEPKGNLVADSSGNLYGTGSMCGGNTGVVFKLTRPSSPSKVWTETLLDSAISGSPESGVIFDAAGNLYGTARFGTTGLGLVFELSPPATEGGQWTEKVLYNFQGGLTDGADPAGGVVFDKAGNLYGVTARAGSGLQQFNFCMNGCGVVYKLTPSGTPGGAWTETVLHTFTVKTSAIVPVGALVFDGKGNLYGATLGAGADGRSLGAAAYRLTPPSTAGGSWNFRVLFPFGGPGQGPQDSLTFHNSGRLYGTTSNGGQFVAGSVFELVPPAVPGNTWTENVLYSFNGVPGDGLYPMANVVFDNAGSLYGTTPYGGSGPTVCLSDITGCGTVFKLSPPTTEGGNWAEAILHSFTPGTKVRAPDGALPTRGLLYWKNGVLFGVTPDGGHGGEGTVFGVVP
jgi:hypothetical protein